MRGDEAEKRAGTDFDFKLVNQLRIARMCLSPAQLGFGHELQSRASRAV